MFQCWYQGIYRYWYGLLWESLYMQPDRVIVPTYRWPDCLSTILDIPNALTCQSASTDHAPRDPFHSPVTWNPAHFMDMLCLQLLLRLRLQSRASPLLSWFPQVHCWVMIPPIDASDPSPWALSLASVVFLVTLFDLIRLEVFHLIRLNCGFDLIGFNCLFSI